MSQEIQIEKMNIFSRDLFRLWKCYIASFPSFERIFFPKIIFLSLRKDFSLYTFSIAGEFLSFAFVLEHEDYAYLIFYAVSEDRRGEGFGTECLRLLSSRYKGLGIIMESVKVSCSNMVERKRRAAFYSSCGFSDTGYYCRERGQYLYDIVADEGFFKDSRFDYEAFLPLAEKYGIAERGAKFGKWSDE